MELVKHNIYKIKKVQRIFNGHKDNGNWKIKQKTTKIIFF